MILISLIITLLYLILIGSFIFGFDKVKTFKLIDIPPKTTFSVIIPFRNEAENLPELLASLSALQYPKQLFEIIFVDDDSEDHSADLIKKFFSDTQKNIKLISNERKTNSPKKDAISTAIKQAKHEWIVTTDADCSLPKYWLNSFDECIQKTDPKCIVAPLTYHKTNNFLHRFQLLDILSLQGATIGGFGIHKPFLCNGANFGYQKSLFQELNGFEGNTNIASGDDVFLLEKAIKKYPKQIHYLKSEQAIITTSAQPSWNALISQRVRWASKTTTYTQWFSKLTAMLVLLMNGLVITTTVLVLIGFFKTKILVYLLVIKFNLDFLLIYKSALFFNQKQVLRSYLIAFVIYPFFSTYVAFKSTFKPFEWKGRSFKK
jgi:biofilm PGA synthesis N-glycosyltransferase PgaC